jgi:hypothetical protein
MAIGANPSAAALAARNLRRGIALDEWWVMMLEIRGNRKAIFQ